MPCHPDFGWHIFHSLYLFWLPFSLLMQDSFLVCHFSSISTFSLGNFLRSWVVAVSVLVACKCIQVLTFILDISIAHTALLTVLISLSSLRTTLDFSQYSFSTPKGKQTLLLRLSYPPNCASQNLEFLILLFPVASWSSPADFTAKICSPYVSFLSLTLSLLLAVSVFLTQTTAPTS